MTKKNENERCVHGVTVLAARIQGATKTFPIFVTAVHVSDARSRGQKEAAAYLFPTEPNIMELNILLPTAYLLSCSQLALVTAIAVDARNRGLLLQLHAYYP